MFNKFLYILHATFFTKINLIELRCGLCLWMSTKFRQILQHLLCYHLLHQLIAYIRAFEYLPYEVC